MKTKFTQVLKVKKQNLENIELNLMRVRADKNRLEMELGAALVAISEYKMPKSGDYNALKIAIETQNLLKTQKNEIAEKIELTKKAIAHFEFQYKRAFVEYEKINFLEKEEIKKQIAKIKRQEAAMLDEIATQRYSFIKANE